MKHMNITQFNTWAKNHIVDDNKFDRDGFIIMKNDTNYKSTGIISKIFEDHWNDYYSRYNISIDSIRSNANKEIKKVIDCANHNLGASVFVWPNDSEIIFSHHTCKGKLCSSCGIKSQKIKTQNILEKCINTKHRHITFTIPNDLNIWFFDSPHTFGGTVNFNPHIHVIIAEGLIDKNKNFKKYNYFNYDALSKRFMKILLDKMKKHFRKDSWKYY